MPERFCKGRQLCRQKVTSIVFRNLKKWVILLKENMCSDKNGFVKGGNSVFVNLNNK